MADKKKGTLRWLRVSMEVIDTPDGDRPGNYSQQSVAEAKLTIPVGRGQADLLVVIDEVGTAIRNQVSQAARVSPLEEPEPEPVPVSESTPAAEPVADLPF